jgi:hypothetical protein
MKYFLILVLGLYINVSYAQVKHDSLPDPVKLSDSEHFRKDSINTSRKALEKEVKPILDYYLKMKLLGRDQNPDLDFDQQLQIKNEYNYTTPSAASRPEDFSNYYLKKCERLDEIRQIALAQKKGLFKALQGTQPDESKELKFIREFLGVTQTTAVLIMAAMSLAR